MIAPTTKVYYSIKEVSELLQVPLPTLRFWEREVQQLTPRKNAGHTRFYSEEDIQTLRRLIYFRSQNIPVKEWTERLKLNDNQLDREVQARENLLAVKAELEALRNLL